jgi:hypothetical protein
VSRFRLKLKVVSKADLHSPKDREVIALEQTDTAEGEKPSNMALEVGRSLFGKLKKGQTVTVTIE